MLHLDVTHTLAGAWAAGGRAAIVEARALGRGAPNIATGRAIRSIRLRIARPEDDDMRCSHGVRQQAHPGIVAKKEGGALDHRAKDAPLPILRQDNSGGTHRPSHRLANRSFGRATDYEYPS